MGIQMRLGLDSSSVTAIEVVVLRPNRCQEMIRPYSHPDCASQDYMPQCHQPLLTSLPPTTTTFHFRFESFTPATDIPHITPKGLITTSPEPSHTAKMGYIRQDALPRLKEYKYSGTKALKSPHVAILTKLQLQASTTACSRDMSSSHIGGIRSSSSFRSPWPPMPSR